MAKATKVLVYRHTAVTRLTHWINVLAVSLLILSGLQIFNAHPALYWGQKSHFDDPWVSMTAEQRGDSIVGVTKIGALKLETTGLFGWSGKPGMQEARGFPAWATIPSFRDLADGRRWHFFFAWLFVINGVCYIAYAVASGHLNRDLLPTRQELRDIGQSIAAHLRFHQPTG